MNASSISKSDILKFLLSRGAIQASGIALIAFIFFIFRALSYSSDESFRHTLSSLLRSEVRSANSYAVAKTISDFESLGLLTCSSLTEVGDGTRIFYTSAHRGWCAVGTPIATFAKIQEIHLKAGNGTSYLLLAQRPIQWSDLFLELSLYLVTILMMILLTYQRKRIDLENLIAINDLEFQKNEMMDRQRQVKHDVAHPPSIIGNTTELKAILSNLMNNCAEAGSKNIWIQVSSTRLLVKIRVLDDGRGIPPIALKSLGQKIFSFGKEGLKNAGQGIGVYHAARIIRSWNGSIEFQNRPIQGAEVTITLPAATDSYANDAGGIL